MKEITGCIVFWVYKVQNLFKFSYFPHFPGFGVRESQFLTQTAV